MKQTDCKDALSSSVFLPRIPGEAEEEEDNLTNPDLPRKPSSSPSSPRMYACDRKWNPYHPNRFVSFEDEDVLEIEDHYP
ncbi:hypothetical protein DSO57_1031902 [Entomophthora muscae]|uniref:Uncharacterized protein n=1 Tax=Entomophthora muscae TaxID=34485 RepID=A0ACC2TC12_9FUNG|nr:hypothetical protein DSO57_1031902 [Entomophthora muscae]